MIQPLTPSGVRIAPILIVVLLALYFARALFIPLAFAITLALILAPAVGWLQKLRFRRFPATLAVMLFSLVGTGAIGYLIFAEVVLVISELPSYQHNIHRRIEAWHAPNSGPIGLAAKSVRDLGKELSAVQEPPSSPTLPGISTAASPVSVRVVERPLNSLTYAQYLLQPFIGPFAEVCIVVVFTIFLLADENDLRNRLFRLAGLGRLNVMTQALEDGTQRISRYLVLQLLVNAGFGILCGTGLYLIGVPYAALWGTVAALLRVVPLLGPLVACLMPLLLSLAVFDHWMQPALVVLLFVIAEGLTANWLEPRLYGSHTGISALALLLTMLFWATLWGPAGLVLSTPLTVCVVVLGRHIPQMAFLHILLGDQPVLAPEAHLYQRLLAMDDQEARAAAQQYRESHSLLDLYDSVILPALSRAEQDRHKGALDSVREDFLFLSLREMLAEYSEAVEAPSEPQLVLNSATPGRVLCFPARDQADEIAGAMLAQLLDQAGYATVTFPLDYSAESLAGMVSPTASDVFCISAVPPFGFAHAKTVNQQLRSRFPQTRILIGVWGFTGDKVRATKRFQPFPPDHFVTSLSEALNWIALPGTVLPAMPPPA